MRPETIIQRDIRKALARLGFDAIHVPNGAVLRGDGEQRARQMQSLKRDGLRVGFPDLLVYATGGRMGHIEVKGPNGRVSEDQRTVAGWMAAWGHNYAVCRSVDDALAAVRQWGWI